MCVTSSRSVVIPVRSDVSYQTRENRCVVQFADTNVFYSHPDMVLGIPSLVQSPLNRSAMAVTRSEEEMKRDDDFIEELTRTLLEVKAALDDCLHDDLVESYSIVPFSTVAVERAKKARAPTHT